MVRWRRGRRPGTDHGQRPEPAGPGGRAGLCRIARQSRPGRELPGSGEGGQLGPEARRYCCHHDRPGPEGETRGQAPLRRFSDIRFDRRADR